MRLLRTVLAISAGLAAICTSRPILAAPDSSDPTVTARPAFEQLREHFLAHPELTTTPGSGWKPYNRAVWFAETRSVPEGVSAARIRRDALALGRSRAAAEGTARGAAWFNVGPANYSGRCVGVDFDPSDPTIVYVASASGGLWKSNDGGDSWAPRTEDLPSMAIGAVCVLAWNPNIVLIGTGEGSLAGTGSGVGPFAGGIFKSTDAGATWNLTDRSYPLGTIQGFSVIEDNPATHTILAGASDGLWRSTDEGDTWTLAASNGNYFDVKWKPGDPNRVYVARGADPFVNPTAAGHGVRVSTDDGLTFTRAGTGQPLGLAIAKTKLAVTVANPNVIYAHYVSASSFMSLGTYQSTDNGATWQVQNNTLNMTGQQGWYNLTMTADPNDADRLLTAGVLLYQSDDGGVNNAGVNDDVPFGDDTIPHWDTHALAYEPGSTSNVWVTNDGGVWRSTDDGATWRSRREGIMSYQFYDICVAQSDPTFAMGGTQDNGIPGHVVNDEWFQSTFVADGMVCNINPTNANVVYAEWQFGNHIKSTSGGQVWSPIMNGVTGTGLWVTPVDEDQNVPNHLYTSTNGGIWRTTNGGNLWQNVWPNAARWISISRVDGNVVWTMSGAAVWHTTNDGGTWVQSATYPASNLATKIHAHPTNVATAFVTVGGYATGNAHLRVTTDFGASWSDATGDFPDQPVNTFVADPLAPDDWYMGSDTGVWKSTDAGAHWTLLGNGMSNVVVTDLEIRVDARKLVAGTYGRGAWEIDLAPASTGVADGLVTNPDLMLDRPFPNPVRGEAIFRFAAHSQAPVSLSIFDVAGRRVSVVAEGVPGNGLIRNVIWLTDDVPAGVYFAVLSAGHERSTRKVVVVKD